MNDLTPTMTLAQLVRAAASGDARPRVEAIRALADLLATSGIHIHRLHTTVGERSPWIRYYLWKLRALGARAGLEVGLDDASDPSVDAVAATANRLLDRVGHAVVALDDALADPDARVRAAALRGLSAFPAELLAAFRSRAHGATRGAGEGQSGPADGSNGSDGANGGGGTDGGAGRKPGSGNYPVLPLGSLADRLARGT